MVGVALLEVGIAGLGEGCTQGLRDLVVHVLSGLCSSILFTFLVPSSSMAAVTSVGRPGAGGGSVGFLLTLPHAERIRLLPVRAARWLADLATERHALVFADVVGLFILVPLVGVFLLD